MKKMKYIFLDTWKKRFLLVKGNLPHQMRYVWFFKSGVHFFFCKLGNEVLDMSQIDFEDIAAMKHPGCYYCFAKICIPEMAFTPSQTVNALESFQIVQTATIHVCCWRCRKTTKRTLVPGGNRGCCVSIPEMAFTLTWTVNTLESSCKRDFFKPSLFILVGDLAKWEKDSWAMRK